MPKGKEKEKDRVVIAEEGIKSWTRGMKLGEGSFASVFLATNNDNREMIVVKTIDVLTIERKDALEKERKIMMRCSTPYIVKYLGWNVYEDPSRSTTPGENLCYNLFMEYVQKGSVRAQIQRSKGRLMESIAACYTKDVLKGLNYLHTSLDCIHGDVKCENMLVGTNNIILCDLGSGKFMQEGDLVLKPLAGSTKRRITVTGTQGWRAPEVEEGERQDQKADIFSLGCSIVEMGTGGPPAKYGGDKDDEDGEQPLTAANLLPKHWSRMAKDFVGRCFIAAPDKRPTTDELLEHKWIQNALPFPGYEVKPAAPKRKQLQEDPVPESKKRGWLGC